MRSLLGSCLLLFSVHVSRAQEREKGEFTYFESGPSAGIHHSSTTTLDLNYYTDIYNPMNNRYNLIATIDLGLEGGLRDLTQPVIGFRGGANIAWGLHAENFVSIIAGVQPVLYTSFKEHILFIRPKIGLLFGNTVDLSFGYNWNTFGRTNEVLPYNEQVIILTVRPWYNREARRLHL